MKDSHDNLEPMAIKGGSAFSRRKQLEIAEEGVKQKGVKMGTLPKDYYAQG